MLKTLFPEIPFVEKCFKQIIFSHEPLSTSYNVLSTIIMKNCFRTTHKKINRIIFLTSLNE
jgi:hypothetical protein